MSITILIDHDLAKLMSKALIHKQIKHTVKCNKPRPSEFTVSTSEHITEINRILRIITPIN
jgi:hypothetical protein